ncbi:asparaginase [Xylophilus ampelinus]|uniref:Asparaginase n=1 Tax=Xylophilus ampelinus TaxID=54067 RepID=A0A318SGD3_9BURK|nr:asparaginase [Xylophilus ampelinus]MCS4510637.1 asparaginase [Xylophilus ampelinus]PYE76328.1 asparaginase [Xylophilus ampelinus]
MTALPPTPARKPRIALLATGGTIAGAAASATSTSAYTSAVTGVDALLAAVPQIADLAAVHGEQVLQIGSESFDNARLLTLARRVAAVAASPEVDGIVITHGTDTMEETAYFLHLTIPTAKPIVMTGAMRPGTALSADGPLNLLDAVTVAAHADSAGKGVLLVMDQHIHSGRDVAKTHASRTDAFRSEYGPLGTVADGRVRFYRMPARPHTLASEFDIARIDTLPEVGIVYAHGNTSPAPYEALVDAGARAIVHLGFGGGTVPDYLEATLKAVQARGVTVVRATRMAGGAVSRNGSVDDDALGSVAADDQNGVKARLLAALALSQGCDAGAMQQVFWRY